MPDRTDEIRARLEAATSEPWVHGDRWHVQGASHCECDERYGPLIYSGRMQINGERMEAHVHERPEPWYAHGIYSAPTAKSGHHPIRVVVDTDEYGLMDEADADLIAHAPTDLAYLLAENARLRKVADAARVFDEFSEKAGREPLLRLYELRAALDALGAG